MSNGNELKSMKSQLGLAVHRNNSHKELEGGTERHGPGRESHRKGSLTGGEPVLPRASPAALNCPPPLSLPTGLASLPTGMAGSPGLVLTARSGGSTNRSGALTNRETGLPIGLCLTSRSGNLTNRGGLPEHQTLSSSQLTRAGSGKACVQFI